jgi:hypothetical protein
MIPLAADEDFNNDIVRGLRRRAPSIDIVRVQDSEAANCQDSVVLAWAARQARVLVTHDVTTMSAHAYQRVAAGLPMPGVFQVSQQMSIGQAIEEILLIAECSVQGEWEGQVRHLPLC